MKTEKTSAEKLKKINTNKKIVKYTKEAVKSYAQVLKRLAYE